MTTPAHAAFASGQGYNCYPRTMIELCSNSYLPISGIASAVGQLGWKIAWGPAELVADGESYSLAFIASRTAPGTKVSEFTLVVRGTLAPAIFAYLHAQLLGAGAQPAMGMWTFAGLTPGNRAFNAYLASLADIPFPWRLHNTLDVAPCFWDNLKSVKSLYPSADHFGWADDLLLDGFRTLAAGHDYCQPAGDLALPGTLLAESGHFDWEKEAAHQHHPATYLELVNQRYP